MAHLTDYKSLHEDTAVTSHCYGPNSFKLHRLPVARPGELLGLVGTHSIGKSTALKVLAGEVIPNLGRLNNPPEWQEILTHLKDEDYRSYYTLLAAKKLKVVVKPQEVEDLSCYTEPHIRKLIENHNERGMMKEVCDALELNEFLKARVNHVTSGVLQRVMIAITVLQKAHVYIFDEPSNFLDVRKKFKAAQLIRSLLLTPDTYVIVSDNDISFLDYLSDAIHCFYGKPGAYGIVSPPFNARAGIEIFLSGFYRFHNMRIRDESLRFEKPPPRQSTDGIPSFFGRYKYPDMSRTFWDSKLEVEAGEFYDTQILVVLGENGIGKTLFLDLLAGVVSPDMVGGELRLQMRMFNVSYKPKKGAWKFDCTVRELPEMRRLLARIVPEFVSDVMKPLGIEQLLDRKVASLSNGEFQRVAITVCLGRHASVYLIDEPGTYLDADLRLNVAVAIKRHILRVQKAAIVVEDNLIMATYLADQVIVVEGKPGAKCTVSSPCPLVKGMNRFLSEHLNITFSRDEESFNLTPRVNKEGSIEDRRQKAERNHYNVGLSDYM
ncbi:ABC transporter-like [Arabidopsis thaliana x Arabidopsis arenosa]|uniref:ABC transporter-like n=1 Tax=Arabidopsis thaliana x Arabidopsis arenosa TaxID=1240361 RepID=A0A8T1YYM3_9BRAS|nr:ABC transporter-like [Arabidopsis thaliana x Arabidopsis arenosa]